MFGSSNCVDMSILHFSLPKKIEGKTRNIIYLVIIALLIPTMIYGEGKLVREAHDMKMGIGRRLR